MITNFEEITKELNEEELKLIQILIKGFSLRTKQNPIKAPEIVNKINLQKDKYGLSSRFTEVKLRKIVHFIRVKGILPLIAASDGYYVSYDKAEIEAQIKSLNERSESIRVCADGLQKFLNKTKHLSSHEN